CFMRRGRFKLDFLGHCDAPLRLIVVQPSYTNAPCVLNTFAARGVSTLITDPNRIAALAAERDDENWRFRTYLKSYCRWSDAKLNRIAQELGHAAEAQIECVTCGACCHDNVVPLSDDEIDRLAVRVHLPVIEFRTRYVIADAYAS